MKTQSSKPSKKVQNLIAKLDNEAKAQNLPSWMHLMAKQDPAMADIMARMIEAELASKKLRPGCDLCAANNN